MKNFVIPPTGPIDPIELSDYLQESVLSFSNLTGVAVTYFDQNNRIVHEFGKNRKPCYDLGYYDQENSPCRQTLSSAALLTSRLGEPYIFLCQAGLTHIAVSLMEEGVLYGCFIAGPIAMGGLRKGMLRRFRSVTRIQDENDEDYRKRLSAVPSYPPKQISELALLFYNSILSAVSDGRDYRRLRRQNLNQSDINDAIRDFKKSGHAPEYPYAQEAVLIEHVKEGEIDALEEDLNQLIHRFSVLEAGSLEGIRTKILWLFAVILRVAADRGKEINVSMDDNLDIINGISEAKELEELKRISLELIQSIARNMITHVYKGNSQIITDALRFIHQNYQKKISLHEVSDALHVNSSYFSSLFRQEISMTFTDYVNQLRVGHACRLLTGTNLSIVEIANASGFDDQSYFTRVFRRYKEITPHAYRKTMM